MDGEAGVRVLNCQQNLISMRVIDFFENVPGEIGTKLCAYAVNFDRNVDSLSEAINQGFSWSNTPEGDSYWQSYADHVQGITTGNIASVTAMQIMLSFGIKKVKSTKTYILISGKIPGISLGSQTPGTTLYSDIHGNHAVVNTAKIKEITREEYDKYVVAYKEEMKNIYSYSLEEENKKDYRNISYNVPAGKYINQLEFLITGVQSKDTFIRYNLFKNKEIFSKGINLSEQLIFPIPYDWAIASSYNEAFIAEFITGINILRLGNITYEIASDPLFKSYPASGFVNSVKNNKFYKFTIKANDERSFFFLLRILRNIYLPESNNIPGLFMQLCISHPELSVWQNYMLAEAIAPSTDSAFYKTSGSLSGSTKTVMPNIYSELNKPEYIIRNFRNNMKIMDAFNFIMCEEKYYRENIAMPLITKKMDESIINYKKIINTNL